MIKLGKHIIIGWSSLADPHWGYDYDANCDYQHEICFYKLFICWEERGE